MTVKYSTDVRYHPWIGGHYWRQEQRWLVLGESTYGLDPAETFAVQDMIRAHCGVATGGFERGVYRVCAATERLMTGQDDLGPTTRHDFWQTVAFYNFVRDSLPASTARPTPMQFKQSLAAFNEVICEVRPHVVLVLGLGLWDALPGERDGWTRGRELEVAMPAHRRKLGIWTGYAECTPERHTFACFPVAHPSSRGFAASRWRDWMASAKNAIAAGTEAHLR